MLIMVAVVLVFGLSLLAGPEAMGPLYGSALISAGVAYWKGERNAWDHAKEHYESSEAWRTWQALEQPDSTERIRKEIQQIEKWDKTLVEEFGGEPDPELGVHHERMHTYRADKAQRLKRLLRAVEAWQENDP